MLKPGRLHDKLCFNTGRSDVLGETRSCNDTELCCACCLDKGQKKTNKKTEQNKHKKESSRVLVSQRFPWLPWVQGGAKGGSVNNVMAFIAGRVVRGVLELFAVMGGC